MQGAARSGSSLHVPRDVDGELESLVEQLSEGSAEERGLAAEKLFNKAAEDETARQKAAAVGVIQPLVSTEPHCSQCIQQMMTKVYYAVAACSCLMHKEILTASLTVLAAVSCTNKCWQYFSFSLHNNHASCNHSVKQA